MAFHKDCKCDSGNRQFFTITPSSGSQTTIQIPNTVSASKVTLMEAIIPSSFYNVITGQNDTIDFVITSGPTTYAATIPAGAYTASALATAITSALTTAVNNTWVVTFNTNQFTMTIAGAAAFNLLFKTGVNVGKSLASTMGFAAVDLIGGLLTYTGGNAVQLIQPYSLYVRIQNVGSNSYTVNGQGFSFRVPMTVSAGGLMEADINSDYLQFIDLGSKTTFSSMTLTLCYASGLPVNLNGLSYELVLKLE